MRTVAYISALVIILLPVSLSAQSTPAAPTAFPWEGEVTGSNVFVRSGPGNNWYPTTKLNQGERVLVLGEKFGWFQISPPAESFSYVDASSVDRKPGAKTGIIKQDKTYIRAGSHLEDRKGSTQVVLNQGSTVEIIGETDGFFRIKPPPGATLYITKQYIRPVGSGAGSGMVERHVSMTPPETPPEQSAPSPTMGSGPIDVSAVKIPTSAPSMDAQTPSLAADSRIPTTTQPAEKKPAVATRTPAKKSAKELSAAPPITDRYKTMLNVLESELGSMMRRPMDQQDFTDLRKRYQEIASQSDEYVPAQIAKIRLRQMNDRSQLQLARVDLKKSHQELATYRANMDEERVKIMNRRIEVTKERYDLEGELRESAAFAPELHRYRLIDPNSKATIAYVDIPPSTDSNARYLIGRLVGIRTSGQQFSPAARVPIAVAAQVVDLTPRMRMVPEGAPPETQQEPVSPSNETQAEVEKQPAIEPPPAEPEQPQNSDAVGTP